MNHSGRQSMLPNRETLLCRYHYDPLDRLVDCTPSAQTITRRFYLKDRLATEIEGAVQRSIMQHDDLLLAQQQRQSGAVEAHLFATDQQRSVLNVLDGTRLNPLSYSPYGHRPAENGLLSLLGFNGEPPDPVTGCYLLGNGYRAFNPVLMRFNSPDSWSPFGKGGLNAYAYCVGDPVNQSDPTGHFGNPWKGFLNFLKLRTPRENRAASARTFQPTVAPRPSYSGTSQHTADLQSQTSSPVVLTNNVEPPNTAGNASRAPHHRLPPYDGSTRPPSYKDDHLYEIADKKLNTQLEKLLTEKNEYRMEEQLDNIKYLEELQKNLMQPDIYRTIQINHKKIRDIIEKLP
jgi:RHS repeat-associated protein